MSNPHSLPTAIDCRGVIQQQILFWHDEGHARRFEDIKVVLPVDVYIHTCGSQAGAAHDLGDRAVREIVTEQIIISTLLQDPELLGLSLHSLAYLLVGLMVLACGFRSGRRQGTLAHY